MKCVLSVMVILSFANLRLAGYWVKVCRIGSSSIRKINLMLAIERRTLQCQCVDGVHMLLEFLGAKWT